MLARKKRAAIARKRRDLEISKKPIEVKVSPPTAKQLIKLRAAGRIGNFAPKLTHRSAGDQVSRPNPGSNRDITPRAEKLRYTGDHLVGIGLLHKSNYVPIFNHEEAVSVTRMRRN